MCLDYSRMARDAEKLIATAKDGVILVGKRRFVAVSDRRTGEYEVTENGVYHSRWNTRKISTLRKWLKEYVNGQGA